MDNTFLVVNVDFLFMLMIKTTTVVGILGETLVGIIQLYLRVNVYYLL